MRLGPPTCRMSARLGFQGWCLSKTSPQSEPSHTGTLTKGEVIGGKSWQTQGEVRNVGKGGSPLFCCE